MATVRPGAKSALIIVDFQVGVVASAWQRDDVASRIGTLADRAREAGIPVIWVQHDDEELARGSEAWQWADPLAPAPGELLVHKHFNSAFEDTVLEIELAKLEISHILLAGAATNWCIRATAFGALDRGYDLTLVSDAHTTRGLVFPDGPKVSAVDLITDLNATMSWLSYPGRNSRALTLSELNFGTGTEGQPL